MRVILNYFETSVECNNVEEITEAIGNVMPDATKAMNLAAAIMEVAQNRPLEAPPLVVNLNKE